MKARKPTIRLVSDPIAALDGAVPEQVRRVCARLHNAGHEAYIVGGCVRDVMLGREPKDWDVATSATPDQVMVTFDKTIPTGIKHGTVTVLVSSDGGRLADRSRDEVGSKPASEPAQDHRNGSNGKASRGFRIPVEVTTFRGEGAYSDGRRPDKVIFGVPLREDLARRDLVINAMAFDPVARRLADPFGGADDLASKRIRAVGDPRERFSEDGLRVMRAVRFAAVLEFELDPDTEAAIEPCLPVLAQVSRERVRDELIKMLAAREPSRGVIIARRTGILHAILPELDFKPPSAYTEEGETYPGDYSDDDPRWTSTVLRVDYPTDPGMRMAGLLYGTPELLPASSDDANPLRRLKFSNADIERIDRVVRFARRDLPDFGAQARRALGRLGRQYLTDVCTLWRSECWALLDPVETGQPRDFTASEHIAAFIDWVETVRDRGDPLTTSELAITGGDVMRELGIEPGPLVGRILGGLLDRVLEDPFINDPGTLAQLAREIHGELTA